MKRDGGDGGRKEKERNGDRVDDGERNRGWIEEEKREREIEGR